VGRCSLDTDILRPSRSDDPLGALLPDQSERI
jgi:hypothetical protein